MRSIPRLTAALLVAGAVLLIVIAELPEADVVIAAACAKSALLTVNVNADSLPLSSLNEKSAVEAATAAYAAEHPMHIMNSLCLWLRLEQMRFLGEEAGPRFL